ncbi:hypothetical protein ACFPN2_22660 [Steroidobacter flavus]|uniref:Uncharacterized protein n=1 Tax=Steroidobacter flavus TaxID=1842136 RepID=A0ABV8SWI5_9GAMM
MTPQRSVMMIGDGPDVAAQRSVLATLPLRFRLVSSVDVAEALLVSGSDAAAAQALEALNRRSRALFIASAAQLSPARIDELCQAAGDRPVMFGIASAASLSEAALQILDCNQSTSPFIVDSTGDVGSESLLRTSLLEQLTLLETLGGRVTGLDPLVVHSTHVIAAATLEGAWRGVRLTARIGTRDGISLRTVSRAFRREIRIVPAATAKPADVAVFDAVGRREPQPLYQSGYRQCWIDLHGALEGQSIDERTGTARRHLLLLDRLFQRRSA